MNNGLLDAADDVVRLIDKLLNPGAYERQAEADKALAAARAAEAQANSIRIVEQSKQTQQLIWAAVAVVGAIGLGWVAYQVAK